ncbi:MAG TPA: hypothetical protein VEV87_09175, partial [Chitinophagaceae bacterium]|nr:hypothetical protein [Chitinophagaceae bacterium]
MVKILLLILLACSFLYFKGGINSNRQQKLSKHPVSKQQAGRKPGSPLDHLPSNITILTQFGERADFSPDNQQI